MCSPMLRPRGVVSFKTFLACVCGVLAFGPVMAEAQQIAIVTSNKKLDNAFNWAVEKALSYVQTGKSGPVDRHERSAGNGNVPYIPCYWAGYTSRTAFYSRDYCHQAAGAHLLGLQAENLTMLKAFARTATADRKWFPLWAINFDGSDFRLDYRGDDDFVREIPAVFELVEQCYRQLLWTANPEYINDPVLLSFCERAVTDFISLHDTRVPNGVAESDGSGDIFRGSATYNEVKADAPLVEAGDGIACQYQALRAYSEMLSLRGEKERAEAFAERARQLKSYFNRQWSVKKRSDKYVRGYDLKGRASTDFGLENSWFMPMKLITEPGARTSTYLDFIAKCVASKRKRPSNLEAISYLPGVFFAYNRVDDAWKWLEYISDQEDREYPEISYTLVSHVVEGLLGFEPNAPEDAFATVPRLPAAIENLGVDNISLGNHRVSVCHDGNTRSRVTHVSGDQPLAWEARFYGEHSGVRLNGETIAPRKRSLNGLTVSYVTASVATGQTATAEVVTSGKEP